MTPELLATLRDLPGRCHRCGYATAVQGHNPSCVDADEPDRLAAAGMARAEAGHPGDVQVVDAAIRAACAKGEPFSANSFRHLVEQVEQPNVIGARIRAALMARRIRRVGDEPSTLPGTHSHRIGRYLPT